MLSPVPEPASIAPGRLSPCIFLEANCPWNRERENHQDAEHREGEAVVREPVLARETPAQGFIWVKRVTHWKRNMSQEMVEKVVLITPGNVSHWTMAHECAIMDHRGSTRVWGTKFYLEGHYGMQVWESSGVAVTSDNYFKKTDDVP